MEQLIPVLLRREQRGSAAVKFLWISSVDARAPADRTNAKRD